MAPWHIRKLCPECHRKALQNPGIPKVEAAKMVRVQARAIAVELRKSKS